MLIHFTGSSASMFVLLELGISKPSLCVDTTVPSPLPRTRTRRYHQDSTVSFLRVYDCTIQGFIRFGVCTSLLSCCTWFLCYVSTSVPSPLQRTRHRNTIRRSMPINKAH